jgi:hypothetical protein
MKTHAHTQGPWHMGAGNGEGSIFADNGRTRLETGGATLYPIARIGLGWNEVEDEANARLIAAAPELMAALIQAVDALEFWFPRWGDPGGTASEMMNQARAAIAKATGRGEA